MATADPGSVARTGNAYVDSLLWGDAWDQSSGPITYAFAETYYTDPWFGSERAAFSKALTAWSDVANLSFRASSNWLTSDLAFFSVGDGYLDAGVYAQQDGPSGYSGQGMGYYAWEAFDDWFGQLQPGGFAYSAIVHELGHALGLAHPHDRADGWSTIFPGVTPNDPADTGNYGLNTWLYTVMSYNNYGQWWAPDGEAAYGFVAGPMAFDIAAIQHIYGANMATRTGSDTYVLPGGNREGTAYRCVWDAGGTDTIAYSGSLDVTIDLRAAPLTGRYAGGYLSQAEGVLGGFTIAHGVVIERAFGGSGDDRLTGNDADNRLYGGRGADLMAGGRGNDLYRVDDADDRVAERRGEGIDTVEASLDHTLADDVERLVLIGRATAGMGNALANEVYGTRSDDTLDGAAGGDTLGGNDGDDTLLGGSGDDTLTGGSGRDQLDGGSGYDIASYQNSSSGVALDLRRGTGSRADALGDRLSSIEGLIGSSRDDTLTGRDRRDGLRGGTGRARLAGGDGPDTLAGAAGSDRLYGGDGGDRLYGGDARNYLYGGVGADRLYADLDIGSLYGGDDNDLLYGSALADRLSGDLGNDRLYGGEADDVMYGGKGIDSLSGGNGNDRIDGSDDGDILYGGSGNDRLYGGNGNDVLDGGRGDDRLYIDIGQEMVSGGSGVDIAYLSGSRADYRVDRIDPSRVVLRQGHDTATLVDVEYLRFSDGLLTNVNHPPGAIGDVNPAADQAQEGAPPGTLVGITVQSSDIDGDRLTYRLLDDADGRFAIDRLTGVVTVGNGADLDRESDASHVIVVRATDRYGLYSDRSFVVDIADRNEAPGAILDLDPAVDAVAEDAVAGTAVGVTAAATDPDGDRLAYSLVVDADGRFAIDSVSGVLRVAEGAQLDHETAGSHLVRVLAVDGRGLESLRDFTIAVIDVNEAPTTLVDIDDNANSVSEDAAAGAAIGITALAADPDGDDLVFSLTDDAGGRFAVDPTTGIVTVAVAGLFDSEVVAAHDITIRAEDAGGLAVETMFTIAVVGVGDALV